jgi:hypothetical protein
MTCIGGYCRRCASAGEIERMTHVVTYPGSYVWDELIDYERGFSGPQKYAYS